MHDPTPPQIVSPLPSLFLLKPIHTYISPLKTPPSPRGSSKPTLSLPPPGPPQKNFYFFGTSPRPSPFSNQLSTPLQYCTFTSSLPCFPYSLSLSLSVCFFSSLRSALSSSHLARPHANSQSATVSVVRSSSVLGVFMSASLSACALFAASSRFLTPRPLEPFASGSLAASSC